MTSLSTRMTDVQRFSAIILVTLGTIIAIGAVNLIASFATKSSTQRVERILSVCVEEPHGEQCQREVLPEVFSEANPEELRRYRLAIAQREAFLRIKP